MENNGADISSKPFAVMDHIPVGTFIVKGDYTIIFWNSRMEEWTGIDKGDIEGTDIRSRFPHLGQEKYSSRIADIFEGGPPAIFSSQLHGHFLPSPLPGGELMVQHTTVTSIPSLVPGEYCALFSIQDMTGPARRIHDYRETQELLRQKEALLRRQERALNAAQEIAGLGSWEWNLGDNRVAWSDELCRIFGYEPFEVEATYDHFLEALHPDDKERVLQALKEALDGNRVYKEEHRIIRQGGLERTVLGQGKVYYDEDGQPLSMIGTVQDITELKAAETAVTEGRRILELILEYSLAGYWDWRIQEGTEYLSPTLKRMLGYEDHQLPNVPETWQGLIFPEDLPGVLDCYERHEGSMGKIPFYNEVRYRHRDGGTIWVICTGRIIERDEEGNPLRMVGCHIDITKRKEMEDELKKSELWLDSIFHSLEEAVLVVSPDRKLIEMNRASEKMFGYSIEELMALSTEVLHIDHDHYLTFGRRIAEAFDKGESANFEFEAKRKDGKIFPTEHTVSLLKDDSGEPIGIVSVIRDITERKVAEAALLKARDELERRVKERTVAITESAHQLMLEIEERKKAEKKINASLKEKDMLLREVHHRVKNNMQVINSLLRLQSEKIRDEGYAAMLRESQERIQSMSLIHETLYKSKDFVNVDFKDYVKTLVNTLFRSHGINVNKVRAVVDVENVSLGLEDAIPCGLIINELVSNTLKYAFPGGENGEIKVMLHSTGKDKYELLFSDNGVGIPEEVEVRGANTMGLYLVHMLAEKQLAGEVELSREGGTGFRISFKSQQYRPRI